MTGVVSVKNSVDTGHEDMIHDSQMDYYGRRLATCSSDRTVKIFDVSGQQTVLLATLTGHEGPVWQLSWAHPKFGNILASCSYDRKVIIWKETSGKWSKLHEFCEHKSSVNSIQWAPHELGLVLACGSSDESFSILYTTGDGNWQYSRQEGVHTLGCNSVSWAPSVNPGSLVDGNSRAAPSTCKRLVTGGGDNSVKVWREEGDSWTMEDKLEGHTDWVRDVAWAPSIGLPVSRIASCSQDCTVIMWTKDESSGGKWTSKVLNTFPDVVWHVSWSITGDILAVSGGDHKVTLWKESNEDEWVCVSEMDRGVERVS
ncbi:PREDICTED: protein SEC13 homolog [Amphimedon queenslandica]|uniref:Protein SEC13 homolog n=1 Tax=Amphimedon queenslandica TaxID=400682 RepID=A0A1X7TM37_AMPQE|nr:PREDICTED: protein SEC13 homolog [Amphimedon queenslandica]|eukprot:XP_011407281.1 PREDICTED: protein SEC13 homolog [Amphimedon queenslandica]